MVTKFLVNSVLAEICFLVSSEECSSLVVSLLRSIFTLPPAVLRRRCSFRDEVEEEPVHDIKEVQLLGDKDGPQREVLDPATQIPANKHQSGFFGVVGIYLRPDQEAGIAFEMCYSGTGGGI